MTTYFCTYCDLPIILAIEETECPLCGGSLSQEDGEIEDAYSSYKDEEIMAMRRKGDPGG